MSKPIASFSFQVANTGLSVTFTDRSVGSPDAWAWDFSAGGTSTVRNPTVSFPAAGPYICTLICSKGSGLTLETSDPYSFEVLVENGGLGVSLMELIKMDAPPEFDPNYNYLAARIKNWQLYLQDSPTPHISDEDVFDETKWPTLYNLLIAKLAIYDYMTLSGKALLIAMSSGGSNSANIKGPVKRIETGPSNVEWYDLSSFWSNLLKTAGGDGILSMAVDDICAFASKLAVYLPMCPIMDTPHLFSIVKPIDPCKPITICPCNIPSPPSIADDDDTLNWTEAEW